MPKPTDSAGVAFISLKTIGLSRVNGRKPCTLGAAARHNLREIQAEIGASGSIDPRRVDHNIIIDGPLTAAEVESKAALLMAGAVGGKLRKDYVQAIEVMFQAPPSCPDPSAYLKRCADWIKGATGLPVLSAVIHHDESSPHAHLLLLPVKGGRYVGGEPLGRSMLKQLLDDFFAKVAGPAGFQRHSARLRGEMKRRGVQAVEAWFTAQALHESCGPVWPIIRATFERDPTQFIRLLGIDLAAGEPIKANPIGIAGPAQSLDGKPIGIAGAGLEDQSLSLCRDRRATPLPKRSDTQQRLSQARQVLAQVQGSVAIPAVVPDDGSEGGLTRVRDEFADDCSAWGFD